MWLPTAALLAAGAVAGCAGTSSTSLATERLGRGQALVVARVSCEVDGEGRKPYAWPFFNGEDIEITLANLDTGGIPVLLEPCYFSSETVERGWVCAALAPGDHYLHFGGAYDKLAKPFAGWTQEKGDFWHIRVPLSAQAIYAGSIHFSARSSLRLFGKRCDFLDQGSASLLDQSEIARGLLDRFLPGVALTPTPLMAPHSSTFLFWSPEIQAPPSPGSPRKSTLRPTRDLTQ